MTSQIELIKRLATSRWFKNIFDSIKNSNRFILDAAILNELNSFFTDNKAVLSKEIKKGTQLYRARIIPFYQNTLFSFDEMLAPPAHKATAGRMNPVGIPYLYTADCDRTAILELRPWRGLRICVATLETVCDLKVFNSITADSNFSDNQILEKLSYFNELFSLPNEYEDNVGYTPTQYLAEAIKNNNYDGVLYKSSLCSKGNNIAIFNASFAKVVKTHKVDIKDVEITYSDNIAELESNAIVMALFEQEFKTAIEKK